MRLKQLALSNFKGMKNMVFKPDGLDVSVLGCNASGKTTLFDAYMFLLVGKDSLGQAPGTFEIKTIDDGETIHNIDHIVEGILDFDDGELVSLKKIYREKYTKKRGSKSATLTGHTTEHFIDDVPKTETEFKRFIDSVIPLHLLELLSDVRRFSEKLDWKERRRILMELCGNISDAAIMESSNEFSRLPKLLGKKTVDDWRVIAKKQQKKLNSSLKEIPTRIDEAEKGKFPIDPGVTRVETKRALETLMAKRKSINAEITRINDGGEIAVKIRRLRELEAELQEVKNAEQETARKAKDKTLDELDRLQGIKRKLSADLADAIAERTHNSSKEASINAKLETLRSEYRNISAREFTQPVVDTICRICGQQIPEEQIEQARQKAFAEFNREKAEELAANIELGKSTRQELDELLRKAKTLASEIDKWQKALADNDKKISALNQQIDAFVPEDGGLRARRESIEDEIRSVDAVISELRIGSHDPLSELNEQASQVDAAVAEKESLLAQIESNQRADARIRELQREQKKIAQEYEKLEAGLNLTDRFIAAKIERLTTEINSKFRGVDFKLFDLQINGAIKEICETMVDGIPYRNLNEAARINAGIEIVNVLSAHYGISIPMFIDGAESITDVRESESQQIKLIVDGQYKELTFAF